MSRLSVEIFMSHSAENFRKGTQLFLRKFLVTKKTMNENGGITFFRFPSKTFGLTLPKKFVGIPSMSQKNWSIEKFYAKKGVSQFSVEIFLSHSAEKLRKGT